MTIELRCPDHMNNYSIHNTMALIPPTPVTISFHRDCTMSATTMLFYCLPNVLCSASAMLRHLLLPLPLPQFCPDLSTLELFLTRPPIYHLQPDTLLQLRCAISHRSSWHLCCFPRWLPLPKAAPNFSSPGSTPCAAPSIKQARTQS